MLSEEQFQGWMRYAALEPWGEERADLRMQRQVWATLQPHAGKKRLDERKFGFNFEPKRRLTPEEYKAKSMNAYRANGGVRAGT